MIRGQWIEMINDFQDRICRELEECDGVAMFEEDLWKREGGGGGRTRIIKNGNVFQKGGVNTSVVHGDITESMVSQLKLPAAEGSWFAAGISIVLHPLNPFVPTIHCNYRMFEVYDNTGVCVDQWFGGGTDLTPYYLFEEDALHFHKTYKQVCDVYDHAFYKNFKKNCDDYFVNHHRNNERRGIGGIFYDYQRQGERKENFWLEFARACGSAFTRSYLPIVQKRKGLAYHEPQVEWQEIERGRYVEFNLVHDRGTIFGLKTNGRVESILMSLPPKTRFEYNHQPLPGSAEEELLKVCLEPVDWV